MGKLSVGNDSMAEISSARRGKWRAISRSIHGSRADDQHCEYDDGNLSPAQRLNLLHGLSRRCPAKRNRFRLVPAIAGNRRWEAKPGPSDCSTGAQIIPLACMPDKSLRICQACRLTLRLTPTSLAAIICGICVICGLPLSSVFAACNVRRSSA